MILSERFVKARKKHDCAWCNEKVLPGDSAFIQAVVFEGEIQSIYFHEECWSALTDDFHSGNIEIDSETGQFAYELQENKRGKAINFQHVE